MFLQDMCYAICCDSELRPVYTRISCTDKHKSCIVCSLGFAFVWGAEPLNICVDMQVYPTILKYYIKRDMVQQVQNRSKRRLKKLKAWLTE